MGKNVDKVSRDVMTRPSVKPTFLDRLLWFSPRTWWGIVELQDSSSFSDFDLNTLVRGLLGVILPMLVVLLLRNIVVVSDRLLVATLISPWTVSSMIGSIVPELHAVARTCTRWAEMRKRVDEEALQVLKQRIEQGRVHHTRRYDVYLPPAYQGKALLLIPGACVPHAAYSEVASLLSDQGLVVVVVSMEPVCMPSTHLGADAVSMKRIMTTVEQEYLSWYPPTEWSLAGHSMGSFAAMKLALQLNPSHLVFWGMGPFAESRTDLSNTSIPTLVIQGSNDKLCEYTPDALEAFYKDLPPNFQYVTIPGGTHNHFCSYANDPVVDGIPGITKERQHRLVVDATSKFLLQDNER